MFGNMIKNKISQIKDPKQNNITVTNEASLIKLQTLINGLKSSIEKISNSSYDLKINSKGEALITTSNVIFKKHMYDNDFFSSLDSIDFFKKFKNSPFGKELDDFKLWLESNEIKSIIIYYEHDGVGVSSWNSYYLVV